jgi:hypothetical protein
MNLGRRTPTAKSTQLNCFSPPVMLATFSVEIIMAVYTIWRYKMTVVTRLVTVALAMLALFQLSEYYDCTGLGINAADWSRVGYAAITTLPPLGLHLLYKLAGKPNRRLVFAAYGTMVGFIGLFLLGRGIFRGYQCTGNYVIFQLNLHPAWAYGTYYYGWLFTAIGLGMHWANQLLGKGKVELKRLQTVRALIAGYLVFLVPTALANTLHPETRRGIPSIMCGFAVLFALILTFYILPRTARQTHTFKLPSLTK